MKPPKIATQVDHEAITTSGQGHLQASEAAGEEVVPVTYFLQKPPKTKSWPTTVIEERYEHIAGHLG